MTDEYQRDRHPFANVNNRFRKITENSFIYGGTFFVPGRFQDSDESEASEQHLFLLWSFILSQLLKMSKVHAVLAILSFLRIC